MRILGIDPSLSSSGWVLLENGNIFDFGLIKTKKETENRLLTINRAFEKIIKAYKPSEVHVETPFFGKNGQTGLNLAYVRGGLIILCQRLKVPLISFSPQEIKKQITGSGKATKEQVAEELAVIFKEDENFDRIGPFSDKNNKKKTSDIYDALAVAHCVKKSKEEKEEEEV